MPAPRLHLRDAVAADRAFERELFAGSLDAAFDQLDDAVRAQLVDTQFEMRERAYAAEHPDAVRSIVLYDGAPVGRLVVDESDSTIHLIDIAIVPGMRRTGIGSEVFAVLVDRALRSGHPIVLHVERSNTPAIAFYRSHGCREVAADPVHSRFEFTP